MLNRRWCDSISLRRPSSSGDKCCGNKASEGSWVRGLGGEGGCFRKGSGMPLMRGENVEGRKSARALGQEWWRGPERLEKSHEESQPEWEEMKRRVKIWWGLIIRLQAGLWISFWVGLIGRDFEQRSDVIWFNLWKGSFSYWVENRPWWALYRNSRNRRHLQLLFPTLSASRRAIRFLFQETRGRLLFPPVGYWPIQNTSLLLADFISMINMPVVQRLCYPIQ